MMAMGIHRTSLATKQSPSGGLLPNDVRSKNGSQ